MLLENSEEMSCDIEAGLGGGTTFKRKIVSECKKRWTIFERHLAKMPASVGRNWAILVGETEPKTEPFCYMAFRNIAVA